MQGSRRNDLEPPELDNDASATPGTELSGTIEKVGPDITSRRPGQRVYTTARERPHRGGHYAEYVATPAEATFPRATVE
jgi:NADPH:quinone reductase-like Zn-dependent oxidoreductase